MPETQKRKRMENKLIKSWKTPQCTSSKKPYRDEAGLGVYTSLRDLPPPTRPTTVPELDPELTLEDILSHELDQVLSSSSTQLEYQSMLRLYASAPKTSSSAMPSTRLSISASSEETEIIHRSRCHDSVEYP